MGRHNDKTMIKLIIIKLIKKYINYVSKELLKNWLIGGSSRIDFIIGKSLCCPFYS